MSALSPRAQALLRVGRGAHHPSPDEVARVRHSLLTKVAAGAAAVGFGATAATASAASSVGLAAKLVVSALVLSAAGTGVYWTLPSTGSALPLPAVVRSSPRAAAPSQPTESVASATGLLQSNLPTEPPPDSVAPRRQPLPTPGAVTPRAASASDQLLEEARLLGEVQKQLGGGRGTSALEALREYDQRFPGGSLRVEAEAARVHALCQSGRAAEARVAAERFVRRYPSSPATGRVREACSGPAR